MGSIQAADQAPPSTESTVDEQPSPPDGTTAPEAMTLPGRLFNVYAAPGDVFESIRFAHGSHANWIAPTVLSALLGVIFSLVVLGQPDIAAGAFAGQEAALQKQVDAGKLAQEQADKQVAVLRKMVPMMKYFGMAGAVVGTLVSLMVISGLVWVLTAKVLKGDVSFLKTLEMVGLAGMIPVAGGLITMLIVLLKGDINSGADLGLLVGTVDPRNVVHQILAAISLPTFWYNAVLSVGVSRLSGQSFAKSALWVFGFWLVVRAAMTIASVAWENMAAGL